MEKKYLAVGEPYKSNGEDKVFFNRIGETFTGKNGKQYVKLYTMPGVLIHVFDDVKKQTTVPADSGDMNF